MRHDILVDTERGRVPVTAELDPAATAADLRRALVDRLGLTGVLYVDGRTVDDGVALWQLGPLAGRCVSVHRPSPGWDLPWGPIEPRDTAAVSTAEPLELAVVGGLHAGSAVALGAGEVRVGRRPGNDLVLADGEVSREHAGFTLRSDGAVGIRDLGSRNGLRIAGRRVGDGAELTVGDTVGIGESVVQICRSEGAPADVSDTPDGCRREFNRPPRLRSGHRPSEVVVPTPPGPVRRLRFPWAAVLAPLLMGGVMFVVMPQYGMYLVAMMALSPVMALVNLLAERRGGRREHRRAQQDFEVASAQYDAALRAAVLEDVRRSRATAPDPAEIARRAGRPGEVPTAALWQRRPADDDFLCLRIGLHDRPANVVQRLDPRSSSGDHRIPEPPIASDVPVSVDLSTAGVLGVAAPRSTALAVSRALVAQLAVLHSPGDLALTVVTGSDTAADWEWASWVPHTRPGSGAFACERLIAVDGAQADARLSELTKLVEERAAARRRTLSEGPGGERAIVLVLDGARRLRDLRGLGPLLTHGPAVGVYAVCLDAEETALPDECGATVVLDGGGSPAEATRATVRCGEAVHADVLVDGMDLGIAEGLAHALTPLTVLGQIETDGGLPETVRFTDLAALAADPDAVQQRWAASAGGRSATALLGVGPRGPLTVDLVHDGPHALVTGTSGAGKSELLQTFVASLAAVNRPDAMNFVLVDYKGGSAFAACASLPHCVGLVTDLDGPLVRRALDSLSAELRRREALLAVAGAKDIADYWARTGARLPRLVIVVDEFASLVEEIPEFVPGVVGIGMRGRSLGVHVVLATQRPGGVVSADLRANVNLRISLRVTSEAESIDVVDDPAAARIPARQPGRAYLRTGHGELTPFQSARIGWPLPANNESVDESTEPVLLHPRRLEALGRPVVHDAHPDVDEHGRTDLSELVTAIATAAERAGLESPPQPWLPPLPTVVPLATLPAPDGGGLLGLVDRPSAQAQDPFVLDLDATGPVAIAGAVRAGRTTALRTLGAALAATASPADLRVYALDCGTSGLDPLAVLPHCGAVVDGADPERTRRLVDLLLGEITRRQRVLAAGGFGSLTEQRAAAAPDQRLPRVVLLLDRLESYLARYGELDSGTLVDRVEQLLRSGPAVGVVTVLSTDRTGFTHRIASAVAARLVLRQAERDDVIVFGLDPRTVPTQQPPGRGVWSLTGEQVQVAVLDADPSGQAQTAAVRRLGEQLARRWDGIAETALPPRLDPLPEEVDAVAVEAVRRRPRPAGVGWVTLGVGGDHLQPADVDLAAGGGCFVVAGPSRSGRSGALLAAVASRDAARLPAVVVAPRPSPLRELAGAPGVLAVITDVEQGFAAALGEALDRAGGDALVVVDDAELVALPAAVAVMESVVRDVRDGRGSLLAAASTEDLQLNRYRGWLAAARRERTGLLLDPASAADGEVFDLRLPRSTAGGWPVGRALLVERGRARAIQLTRVRPESVGRPAQGVSTES